MKYLIPALFLACFAGTASAQVDILVTGFNNIDDALTVLVNGNTDVAIALTQGDVTGFFRNGNAAFQGFAAELAAGTPALALSQIYRDLTNLGFNTLLPLYQALDGPAMQLAAAGAPLTEPLRAGLEAFAFDLTLTFDGDLLSGQGLSLAAIPLPLGELDPTTLTGLLGGLPLPGL